MKIIYNSILPLKGYVAINLFGLVFVRSEYKPLSNRLKNHEAIHTAQGKELLWIFFYLWYGAEWLIRLLQYKSRSLAYRNISFEREAYECDTVFEYINTRKKYAFFKFLRKSVKYG